MTKVGGDVLTGTSVVSDDKLLHPVFQNSTAIIHVNDNRQYNRTKFLRKFLCYRILVKIVSCASF
jgi:hypothetical protein